MIDLALLKIELNTPDENGITLRQHLIQAADSGVTDSRLEDETEVPDICERAWSSYWKIRIDGPVSMSDIYAFQKVTGVRLKHWEIEAIISIDAAVQAALIERSKKGYGRSGPTTGQTRN